MAALIRVLILAALVSLSGAAPAPAQQDALEQAADKLARRMEKKGWKRVVVGDFLTKDHKRTKLGEAWQERIQALLAAYENLVVVPSERWATLTCENGLSVAAANQPLVAGWLASQADADSVVLGQIESKGSRIELMLEAVDARDPDKTLREKARVKDAAEARALLAEHAASIRQPCDGSNSPFVQPGEGGVSYPQCKFCPDPQYTPEARAATYSGRIVLLVVITPEGRATNIRVLRGLPYGLAERAIEAVTRWIFEPARTPDGTPVAVQVPIEVLFRLM